jgi:hypothetical protein
MRLISRRIVSGASLTPRCSTDWLRTNTPASHSRSIARWVISVSSVGWLKCVCSTTSLCSLRPRSTTPTSAEPRVVRQDLLRHHGRALGREPHAPDVRHVEQPVADRRDLLGPQVVRVAPADDDVLELRPRRDVREHLLPPLRVGLRLTFSTWSVSVPTAYERVQNRQ